MPRLKAYKVREADEGHCVIVFATNNAAARRNGASELDTDWTSIESCHRKPQYDSYAEAGCVPPLELIEDGWWFECNHCGTRVGDGEYRYDEDDEEHELDPVADANGWVFCCPEHMMLHWAENSARKAAKCAAIEAALTMFPGITKVNGQEFCKAPHCGDTELTAVFHFPGGTYPVRWPVGSKELSVSQVDVQAWHAFKETGHGVRG